MKYSVNDRIHVKRFPSGGEFGTITNRRDFDTFFVVNIAFDDGTTFVKAIDHDDDPRTLHNNVMENVIDDLLVL